MVPRHGAASIMGFDLQKYINTPSNRTVAYFLQLTCALKQILKKRD